MNKCTRQYIPDILFHGEKKLSINIILEFAYNDINQCYVIFIYILFTYKSYTEE